MLYRQLARSLWRGRRSYLACVVLMAIGIGVYVSFHLLFVNLTAARDDMYRDQRFGDVFAVVSPMPLSAVERVSALPGVDRLDATLVADAKVVWESSERITTLRLSSFDPQETNRLNDFALVEGALPGEDGVLVGDAFAAANSLRVGDSLDLILEGSRLSAIISGTVRSPEYIYAIPDSGRLMPDNRAFGFGYMPAERLGALTGKTGMATNLSLALEDGESFRSVRPRLEDGLSPHGLISLIGREDQPSHVMLEQELQSVGSMASAIPSLFVLIAVVILYIMLKRVMEQERGQIGVLMAFGFHSRSLLAHYLCYGIAIGLASGLAGVALGVWMTGAITPVYLEFFSLPEAQAPPAPAYLLGGMAVALGAGALGSLMGALPILRLRPGDAMRPPAPPVVRGDVGGLPVLRGILNAYGFMALRNITRNRFRSAFVAVGIAVSFAITAFMASWGDMFDSLMLNQFTKVELYNLKIFLEVPAPYTAALEAAWSLEGVRSAEAMLELPVELRHGHLKKSVSITAVEEHSRLYRIYDGDTDTSLEPYRGGLILSSSLAEDLQAGRGDTVSVKTPYTGEKKVSLPVMGVVQSNLGSTAYIRLDGLWELLETAPVVSGIIVDARDPGPVKAALLEADNVAAVTDQQEAQQIYLDLLETYAAMIYMLQLSGVGIAFAIITNTAAISLSERGREYATMRVLGMYPGEIARVVGLEYWALFALAIPPGIVLTRLFKLAMANMIDNDIFTMPLHTGPSSFAAAGVLCGGAVLLSNLWARGKIAGFDMVGVLKERE